MNENQKAWIKFHSVKEGKMKRNFLDKIINWLEIDSLCKRILFFSLLVMINLSALIYVILLVIRHIILKK